MSWEFETELYLVFAGWFSQMKNKMLPSAETVGLSSAKSELTFTPKFSILRMVEAVMMLSFCGFKTIDVSMEVWPAACNMPMHKINKRLRVFTAKDLAQNNKKNLLFIVVPIELISVKDENITTYINGDFSSGSSLYHTYSI